MYGVSARLNGIVALFLLIVLPFYRLDMLQAFSFLFFLFFFANLFSYANIEDFDSVEF